MEQEHDIRIIPDNWLEPMDLHRYFRARVPLEVDVGCGKGTFLLARAEAHPGTDFLGIDRMLRRIRKIRNKALHRKLDNVRVLRIDAYYALTYLIPPDAVDVYYIFFPDPWPKKRHQEHRFFNPLFKDALSRTLRAGGVVHAATDHAPYYEDIRALMQADSRFEEVPPFVPEAGERTDFERYYIERTAIGRCSFRRKEG